MSTESPEFIELKERVLIQMWVLARKSGVSPTREGPIAVSPMICCVKSQRPLDARKSLQHTPKSANGTPERSNP